MGLISGSHLLFCLQAMEVELDELIKQKKQQNRTQRCGNRRNRRDKDGDVNMGSSRGPGRKPQRQRKPRRDGPYSRSNYNTTGDTSQNWKHDLYNKDEDEIEETGWGSKRTKQEEDLLRGTTVLIDNIHYEVSEEELKVQQRNRSLIACGVFIYRFLCL